MGRPAGIKDKTIIQYIDQYVSLNPNKKIKYVDIENYMHKQGVTIKIGTIKKRKVITEYIKSLNTKDEEKHVSRIMAYIPLDITELSVKTHLTQSAKELLVNREVVIKEIVDSAVAINEENKRLRDLNKVLQSENKTIKTQLETLMSKQDIIAAKNTEIRYYKDMLEKICLPEAFNIIVNNYGKETNVSCSKLEECTLTASKPIKSFANDVFNALMEGFDDDVI